MKYGALFHYVSKKELWENLEGVYNDIDLLEDVWTSAQVLSNAEKIPILKDFLCFYDFQK